MSDRDNDPDGGGSGDFLRKNDDDVGDSVFFRTAAGRKVEVSEEAVSRAKRVWTETEAEDGHEWGPSAVKRAREGEQGTTAKRQWQPPNRATQSLTVSAQSLKKAQDAWQDVQDSPDFSLSTASSMEVEEEEEPPPPPRPPETTQTANEAAKVGFSTASGKKVLVSEKALAEARKVWSQVQEEEDVARPSQSHRGAIRVSQESLSRASQAWESAREEEEVPQVERPFKGVIRVSQETLSRASQAWESARDEEESIAGRNDEDDSKIEADDEDDVCLNSAKRRPMGFSTGSGKTVSISAEALSKARMLWRELEEKADGVARTASRGDVPRNGVADSPASTNTTTTPVSVRSAGRRVGLSRLSTNATPSSTTTPTLGASPALRPALRPRLAFKAPKRTEPRPSAEAANMGNSAESQEFEAEVLGWMEQADL